MLEDKELEFPCHYPIKVVGLNHSEFYGKIYEVMHKHIRSLKPKDGRIKESKNGKYLSVTFSFEALNREHVEAIYIDLRAHDDVVTII